MTTPPRSIDLLIRHGAVITMDDAFTVFTDGAVAIAGSRIVAVGPDAVVAAAVEPGRVIDARGAPVHPGLVEAHLHASYQLHRSVVPDDVGKDEVFEAFERPFYDTVNDDEEEIAVALASVEMLRNGTTTFLEAGTVLTPAAAARAVARVGMRAELGDARVVDPALTARPIRRAPTTLDEAVGRLGVTAAAYPDPDGLVSGHVTLHGLGTASEALLVEAKARADAAGSVLNMHQSYSPSDTARDRERFGRDPVLRLAELGVLGPNLTLGHANYLTDAEADAIVAAGTSVVWSPAASMIWGYGSALVARHPELHRRGANVALGSDSGNWSNDFDLFRQADLALLVARERAHDRRALNAEEVLSMATRGGARAAGKAGRLGVLAPGALADVVIHSIDRPELNPPVDPVRTLIHGGRSKSVDTVIVNGRVVLDHGRFTSVDEPALLAEARDASARLLRRMGVVARPNRR
jgi:cytosine/adenosine deaminase-related metal-dependent hydrolase